MPKLKHLLDAIGNLAPWDLAESWDQVGLQIGGIQQPVRKVMVALDINQQVIQDGLAHQVDGFITHHPLIFKPLSKIDPDTSIGDCVTTLIKRNLFLVAVHTNADKAEKGLNQYLAGQFGMHDIEPLEPVAAQSYKIVVFIPAEYSNQIRLAMAEAGAGIIGEYTICSFEQKGTGTFKPGLGAHPFTGKPGEFGTTPEIRLEMSAGAGNLPEILKAVSLTHPYEEPVVDIYPLLGQSRHGLGRIGNFKTAVTFQEICSTVSAKLSAKGLRTLGLPDRAVKRVALCSGSGGSLLQTVIKKQAELYITGELGYHDFLTAQAHGLMIIEAGHWATEHCFISLIGNYLKGIFASEKDFAVIPSNTINAEPYLTLTS